MIRTIGETVEAIAVNVEQAAQALGIGETLTRELIRRGDLPTVRIGRRVLVPVAGLHWYLMRLADEQMMGDL